MSRKLDLWKYRRNLVFVSTAFGMITIGSILFLDLDTELAKTAINSAFLFMGGVVLTYVGGAVADDYLRKGRK